MRSTIGLCLAFAASGSLACMPLNAQGAARIPVAAYPRPVTFPHPDQRAVQTHFNRARAIAGDDLYVYFDTLCVQDQLYKARTQGAQPEAIVPAQQVFDNVFYVGQMSVGAWAIRTGKGIILIDALNNADEAREIIVPGLVAMGLDPKDVKYVVITHAHGDHYGGARYFKDTYGSVLVASATDWDAMANPAAPDKAQFDAPPRRGAGDLVMPDGGTLTLGEETLHFALTPGHTPGTLSTWFRVSDRGVAHTVGLYGGIGMPHTIPTQRQQITSLAHWMAVTKAAGVDAQIGNHPLHFDGPAKLEILKYRGPHDTNPFVIGSRVVQRYFDLQRECVRLELAREGEPEPEVR